MARMSNAQKIRTNLHFAQCENVRKIASTEHQRDSAKGKESGKKKKSVCLNCPILIQFLNVAKNRPEIFLT